MRVVMKWRGVWYANISYTPGDVVIANSGGNYNWCIAIANSTGIDPTVDAFQSNMGTYWAREY